MCTDDFCNDLEYDIHSERAKRLFNQTIGQSADRDSIPADLDDENQLADSSRGGSSSVEKVVIVTGRSVKAWDGDTFQNQEEDEEKNEIYYEDPKKVEQMQRAPRQLNSGESEAPPFK